MPGLKDNLKRWRDVADIDWFSQFIKAWIPFNAWMSDTFGDETDRELLDKVKSGGNVVYNRILPMLSLSAASSKGEIMSWQDASPEADEFRLHFIELHRHLQACVVDGRRGRVSFETVDIGASAIKDEIRTKWKRTFRVRRDVPAKGAVTVEMSASKTSAAFQLEIVDHNRKLLEDNKLFQALKLEHRSTILAMFEAVAPRRIISVLAPHGAPDRLLYGDIGFVPDSERIFFALIEILYSLRNALFHGSITPNETHNSIYKPAYHLVMRMVQCTI